MVIFSYVEVLIMLSFQDFCKLIYDKDFRWIYLGRREFFNYLSDEEFIRRKFWHHRHRKLDLENPRSFSEKLQWLKLYNQKPEYGQMVDKASVKDYVSSIVPDLNIIPTLGIYERYEDIDFSKLPDKFVMKCTHDSASIFICTDKKTFDFKNAQKKINKSLKKHYYMIGREWPYKYVKPRIIIEQFMVDESGKELKDYKFFCFNGQVKCFSVDFNRFTNHRANYYTPEFELLTLGKKTCPPDPSQKLDKPQHLDEMIDIAMKLSKDIPFVRVDLYNINGLIYFGELTFFPASGFNEFTTEDWDNTLGDWITLPPKTTEQ